MKNILFSDLIDMIKILLTVHFNRKKLFIEGNDSASDVNKNNNIIFDFKKSKERPVQLKVKSHPDTQKYEKTHPDRIKIHCWVRNIS